MIKATRSIYESYITTLQRLGLPFKPMANSTLNENPLINVLPNQAPKSHPSVGYIAAGIGSASPQIGANGLAISQTYIHNPDDAALFYQIPFVAVPVNSDISAAQQTRYALRVVKEIKGQMYALYYLLRLDKTGAQTGLTYTSVANGVATPGAWTPSQKQMNPEKVLFKPGVNLTTGDTLSANAYINLELSQQDISNLINAITIVVGDASYARLSELTICAGEDFQTSYTTASGNSQPFNEAIAVTPALHIVGDWPLLSLTDGLKLPLDLGASEPMNKLTQA